MITEQILDAFFNPATMLLGLVLGLPLVFSLSLWLTRRQHLATRIISPILLAFSTFWFCFLIPFGWDFRDGLGPGMETTHGEEAVSKFMEGFWLDFLIGLGLFVLGLLPWIISEFVYKRPRELADLKKH